MKELAKGTVCVYQGVYPQGNNWREGGRDGKVDRLVLRDAAPGEREETI